MAQVFAGIVCGYLLALVSTPLLASLLLHLRTSSAVLARVLPPGAGVVSLGVILHGGLFLYWTGLGMLLGLVLMAMPEGQEGLGTLSLPFTLMVAAFVMGVFSPVVIFLRSQRTPAVICAIVTLLVFGWLMPHMSGWTKFEAEPEVPKPYWPLPEENTL